MPHIYDNERRGFLTRDAAVEYQMNTSLTPARCSTHKIFRHPFSGEGCIFVTSPVSRVEGFIYVWKYWGVSKSGKRREYYGSYVGA